MNLSWSDRSQKSRIIFVAAIVFLIVLNLYTFIAAYPETYRIDSGIGSGPVLAKDFSAYYIGAWRLFNDPSKVYVHGNVSDGEPPIYPQPEAYKYLPSFLVLVSPLIFLSYQQALITFDVFQFALLPLMALLLYKLLNKKGLWLTLAVAVIVLLLPFPLPKCGVSASYFWQWGEGQAKVFETFLLLLAFYLGSSERPYLSGLAFALAAFDPRFGLLSLPLFVWYNRKRLKASLGSMVVCLIVSNVALLTPAVGSSFLNMAVGSGASTPVYYYAYIPLLTIVSFIVVNLKDIVMAISHSISTRHALQSNS